MYTFLPADVRSSRIPKCVADEGTTSERNQVIIRNFGEMWAEKSEKKPPHFIPAPIRIGLNVTKIVLYRKMAWFDFIVTLDVIYYRSRLSPCLN